MDLQECELQPHIARFRNKANSQPRVKHVKRKGNSCVKNLKHETNC